MAKGEAKNIECEIVKVIHEETYERGGGYQIRVVRWIIDGKRHKPSFEKRETWVDDSGQTRSGKAKGFSAKDLGIMFKNMPDICPAMEMNFQLLLQELGEDVPATVPAGAPAEKESAPWE
jgi:hypothetical protein